MSQFARNLADVVGKVAYGSKSFVIFKGKRAMAEVRPVPQGCSLSDLVNLIDNLPQIDPSDRNRFAEDLEQIRDSSKLVRTTNLWES